MNISKNFIDKIFSDKLKIYGPEQKYLFVKLPYIGKYSARIKRDLMKILKDYRPYMKLRLISYLSIKIGHLFKKSLGQIPFRNTSNVVYKISCACGHSYIGQTCRRVPDRVREHKDNNNNKHFFNLQVANSPSRLRFEANLSRESSECTEHSQDQTSQINTGKTVYVGNA